MNEANAPSASPRLTPLPADDADDRVRSLSGLWTLDADPDEAFWTSPPTAAATSVVVPGEWAMQEFEVDAGATVGYRRMLSVPEGWAGDRVRLRFDSVYSDAVVRVDGTPVGGHAGGFTPFEVDVTDAVTPGESHVLGVAVTAESVADDLASGRRYAGHSLGGITGAVRAFAVPPCHLSRCHVRTTFDDDYVDATLACDLAVTNDGEETSSATVSLGLEAPDGSPVTLPDATHSLPPIPPGGTVERTLTFPVAEPDQWHPEHPRLYRLSCRVDDPLGPTVDRRVGFREVSVDESGLVLNGESLPLRGVCRHETHPSHGRAVSPEVARADADLFRACNANYVRAVHYPPTPAFLDACDELGLLVEVEAPFSWVGQADHADAAYATDPDLRAHVVGPTLETVERDRSHPSVALWSLANESVWGGNFAAAARAVRALDPTRPLVFNWIDYGDDDAAYCDLGVHHYPGPDGMDAVDDPTRPVLFDEYCHVNTYNRRELATDPGLRDYWGRGFARTWASMLASDGCAGGAIWSGVDEVFQVPGADPYLGYGEWGLIDGWRRPKPEYWHVKKIYSPVDVAERTLTVDAGDRPAVTVENGFRSLDLSACRFAWTLGDERGDCHPAVPPGESARVPLDVRPSADGTLSLSVHHPEGYVVDEFDVQVRVDVGKDVDEAAVGSHRADSPIDPAEPPADPASRPSVTETSDAVVVEAGPVRWTVDRATGRLTADRDGECVLVDGPWVTVTPLQDDVGSYFEEPPAPLSGEGGSAPDTHPLEGIREDWTLTDIAVDRDGNRDRAPRVTVTGRTPVAAATFGYEFGDGGLGLSYELTARRSLSPREVGVTLDAASSCACLEWTRDGFWSTYPDDHVGRTVGRARAFGDAETDSRGTRPTWPWAQDATSRGTNDFRSTKYDVREATLRADDGRDLRIRTGDADQHLRAHVADDRVRVLVAAHSNGGADPFFGPHVAAERRSLAEGDVVGAAFDVRVP